MCGIAGIISLTGSSIDLLHIKAMCDALQHRGPDGAGYLLAQTGTNHPRAQQYYQVLTEKKFVHQLEHIPCIDELQGMQHLHQYRFDLFFGHRRLSILDLSAAGFQPMSDLSKKVWVCYNGEIYNFKEIRQELSEIGYEFCSMTDTEVLINAYLEWGIEAILKFNGMFAFSLWDSRINKLFLVRDRYGVKPLYYYINQENQLIFGSEIKAILAYLPNTPVIDYEGLFEYFSFQNFFTDKTLFENVRLLPAGNYLEIDLNTRQKIIQKQYWDFDFRESNISANETDYIEELSFLFEQAVRRQLVSDVEIGSYLSGGIDSGSITAVAAKQLPYIKTFTVGFDLNNVSGLEQGFDERTQAEFLSYLYKTEHYEMVLKSGDMERCLPKFAWHLEEPRVGQSYPNYYASKLAGKFVKVVLSGTGGDELFGGYPWRYFRAVNNENFSSYVDKYHQFWQRLLNANELCELFNCCWHKLSHMNSRDIFNGVFKHSQKLNSPQDYINHSLYFEAKTFLHGLLVMEDKLSMANSLETRVPFLDNDLVEFAQKIPVHLKLSRLKEVIQMDENTLGDKTNNYFKKTNDGKLILRKALQQYMPSKYSEAEKQGFSAPDQSWFRSDSYEFVKKIIGNKESRIYQHLNIDLVQRKLNEHLNATKNNRLFIWSILNFEYFLRNYYE
ncbi:MAG: asparagine synthase (glutamine-hydrolyzing) [Gammaproteobacteria bacterium]|nr:asparagine synthase (glutamine-hydrolyzing) [Gammaproteobacteria bacterium]